MNYKKPKVISEIGCNHKGKLDIVKDGKVERTEDVSKTFRGDFGRSIGIV